MLEDLLTGIVFFLHWKNFLAMFVGVAVGIIFGAIPGLTVTMTVALALPFTFTMEPVTGLSLLLGIYEGGIYGGSISAILISTPGTPAAAATVLDGSALAKKGKTGKALNMALYASVVGDAVSTVFVILLTAPIARMALMFGPPEYFALVLFSLTIIGGVSARSLTKGLLSGALGLLLATVGLDPIYGSTRFGFGSVNLMGGLSFIPVLIGLFAIPEILRQARQGVATQERMRVSPRQSARSDDDRVNWPEFKGCLRTMVRGGFVGLILGAIPGIGAAPSAFVSYHRAMRASKNPGEFGRGSLEGVAAAESGNNGVNGATLIPLLTLGVPGDVITAVILGAFMMQGLTPGPLLFKNHIELVYGLFAALILANLTLLVEGKLGMRLFVKVANVPRAALFPCVLVLCVVGTYAVNNSMFDVLVMLGMGILGYLMDQFEVPPAPFLIGFILGPMLENGMRRSLLMSGGDPSIFVSRPISLFFLALAVASAVLTVRLRRKAT